MSSASAPPVDEISSLSITPATTTVEESEFSQRVLIRSIISRPDGGAGLAGQTVRVGGWVKTGRKQGNGTFAFLELNDGSCPANLQRVELRVQKILDLGTVDPAKYPLPKTKLTLELLRDYVHLRPRTNTISAIARIRNALAYATHTFFQKHGFLYVHTPIITTSDCEGAGEMFQVTTLISDAEKLEKELIKNPPPSEADVEAAKLLVTEKGEAVSQLKSAKANKETITAAIAELTKAKESLSKLEERFKLTRREDRLLQDFFARQAFLTVSGQLQVETFACALKFWMVEPEIAFADIQDDMNCAEAYVRFLCQWLLDNCLDDMEFMVKNYDKSAIDRLRMVSSTKFVRISYTEAVAILEEASKERQFENKVEWGIDLASEHERYLTEVNPDNKTVAAMDVLVPKVGELIGGSQREERYEVIKERWRSYYSQLFLYDNSALIRFTKLILEMGLPLEPYECFGVVLGCIIAVDSFAYEWESGKSGSTIAAEERKGSAEKSSKFHSHARRISAMQNA
ncbi:hypothetical protein C3L33_19362, partial [Rhododendron williamsianum]